jgi:hypothetical protein
MQLADGAAVRNTADEHNIVLDLKQRERSLHTVSLVFVDIVFAP